MSKRKKWRRLRLEDLALAEEQEKLLRAIDRATGQPEADPPEKRASENPQVECSGGTLALTPAHGESV